MNPNPAVEEAISVQNKVRAGRMARYGSIALLLLILIVVGCIRFRLRNIPLERDEGEYAYTGQLILQGVPPFKLAYNLKFPGTYAAYAVIMAVFGQTTAGVHLGLIVVNSATIIVLYLLASRLFGKLAAVVSAATFAILSLGPGVLGLAGHATHFVVLPAVCGLLLLEVAYAKDKHRLIFVAGVFLGTSVMMKQPGVFFPAFGGLYVLYREWRRAEIDLRGAAARLGSYLAGAAIPFGATCLLLAVAGAFRNFWFWTFTYAREHGSLLTAAQGWQVFQKTFPSVAAPAALLWTFGGLGLLLLLTDRTVRDRTLLVTGFFLASAAALVPGFQFREHYFVLVLPAISLLAGVAVSSSSRFLRSTPRLKVLGVVPPLLFFVATTYTLYAQRAILFESTPLQACRMMFGGNPFPEAVQIAEYIRSHSAPSDKIGILGSEPEICFYSGRRSATGYIHIYGLMEEQKYALAMQEEMIAEIEAARPRYMVVVGIPASWLMRRRSETRIISWSHQYLQAHYERVGVTDLLDETVYVWGAEAKQYSPGSTLFIYTFRRLD